MAEELDHSRSETLLLLLLLNRYQQSLVLAVFGSTGRLPVKEGSLFIICARTYV
jgi:hypothetical protein